MSHCIFQELDEMMPFSPNLHMVHGSFTYNFFFLEEDMLTLSSLFPFLFISFQFLKK